MKDVGETMYLKMCKEKRGQTKVFLSQLVDDIKKGKGKRTKKVVSPKTNQRKTHKSSPNTEKNRLPRCKQVLKL